MFAIKIHETSKGKLIAACDKELVGKTFSEPYKNIELTLNITPEFYQETVVEFKQICKELETAKMANLVGNKLIQKLLESGKIGAEEVKKVSKIPHIQLFFL